MSQTKKPELLPFFSGEISKQNLPLLTWKTVGFCFIHLFMSKLVNSIVYT